MGTKLFPLDPLKIELDNVVKKPWIHFLLMKLSNLIGDGHSEVYKSFSDVVRRHRGDFYPGTIMSIKDNIYILNPSVRTAVGLQITKILERPL